MQQVCTFARSWTLMLHPLLPPLLSLRSYRLQTVPVCAIHACASAASTHSAATHEFNKHAAERYANSSAQDLPSPAKQARRRRAKAASQGSPTGQDAALLQKAALPMAPVDLSCGAPPSLGPDWHSVKRWCGPTAFFRTLEQPLIETTVTFCTQILTDQLCCSTR